MKPSLPNLQIGPLDDTGRFTSTWVRFFGGLVGDASSVESVPVPASPAKFTAPDSGHYLVVGGSGVGVLFIRGRDALGTALGAGFIPVSKGDALLITFTAAPVVTFIPA